MKRISEKKLEAFTVGIMGKRQLSKKEVEDQKKKEDEAAAAHAFKEFVETFQDTPTPSSKVWVKAGTYDAGSRREDNREKGKLYKPSSKLEEKSAAEKAQEYAKMLASDLKKDSIPQQKKKNQEKKKSNLELFKEELRQIQEEREERHKYKHMAGAAVTHASTTQATASASTNSGGAGGGGETTAETRESGSFDTGDPNTTNLYLGNLSPKISEQQLMEIFGRYGPLASIKIMWPRSEEEKQRGRNCGFVAYMSRKDAERALRTLNGRYVMSYEMRLGWGKSVPIMNQPIFIPPTLLELTLPPPPSGLPFNAQPATTEGQVPQKINYKDYTTEEEKENMDKMLYSSVVKVFIPTEKSVLNIIHRMIEFVIREGPMFEALIMSREIENPLFSFLFDNESPAHLYYRWKLFSLLQGDTPTEWSEKEFRMFSGGPIWRPPIANFYTQGMSDALVVDPDAPDLHKGALSTAQRDRLEDLIRHLTPERARIGDVMIFCIEHADAADEICECIAESLSNHGTSASKKIARLYLLSDILHNCTVKVSNASFFRKSIEKHLVEIFENMHTFFTSMESRLKAEGLKSRVVTVIRAWEEWAVYPKEFLAQLRCAFLGKQYQAAPSPPPPVEEPREEDDEHYEDDDEDIDGAPMSADEKDDEDLDGVPLDGAALLKGALMRSMPEAIPLQKDTPTRRGGAHDVTHNEMDYSDIDGVPVDDDIDGVPMSAAEHHESTTKLSGSKVGGGAFIPSKWETVDPEQVEAQAITTSKWDTLDPPQPPKFYDSNEESSDDDDDGEDDDDAAAVKNMALETRLKLREIEVKIMQYQDELEAGKRELKSGWNVNQQVEHYRKKLLRKQLQESRADLADSSPSYKEVARQCSESPPPASECSSSRRAARRSKRSPSPSAHHSSSRSSESKYGSGSSKLLSKRHRSRSRSETPPKRSSSYAERALTSYASSSSKSQRYGSPAVGTPSSSARSRRSPSPVYSTSSRSAKRERDERERDLYSASSSSRSDRHKHKHKH